MAEPGSSSSSSSSTRVRSLTKQGSAYLTEYARTINPRPLRSEKLTILNAIHTIPGNEAFTLAKLSNWFTRYRNTRSDEINTPILVDDETILFPKLTPVHLQQLRVLHKKLNDPAEGVITFWAKRINADRQEVASWIEYQQEKAKDGVLAAPESPDVSPTTSEFPHHHLPTPAKSLSPQQRLPSLPPIAVKVEDSGHTTRPLAPYFTEHRSVLDGLPAFTRANRPTRHSTETLTASLRESLGPDKTSSEPPPRTADEFAEKFGRVEIMIDAFLEKYHCGKLIPLGWDSSLTKSVS